LLKEILGNGEIEDKALNIITLYHGGAIMLRQIRYFQAVIRNNSFSEAAAECHISQSAISQQIQNLEHELGFLLLERKNRKFTLTPAGEHFYKKSLILLADYERICQEAIRISRADEAVLKIGYLRCYGGSEFQSAIGGFSAKYPDISVQIVYGNHEELYDLLRNGGVDLILNDQRRAFSDEYVNFELVTCNTYIEIAARNPIAELSTVDVEELKNIPCILISSKTQQETEQEYYYNIVGLKGNFLFVENLEEARIMVISGKGFMPLEGGSQIGNSGTSIRRIPLFRKKTHITRKYCAFWKRGNSSYYVEEFADMLKEQFE